MITHLDDRVGELIGKLKEMGEYENTIIVFAGDNGLAVGQHGLFGKQNMYDHSVRVPPYSGWSRYRKKNRTSDSYVYLVDIFPTLCEHLGMDVPSSVESKSFKKVLDRKERKRKRSYLYSLHRYAESYTERRVETDPVQY